MTFRNLSIVWGPTIFSDITSDLSEDIFQTINLPNLILSEIFNKYDKIFCNDYSSEKNVLQESFQEKNKLI